MIGISYSVFFSCFPGERSRKIVCVRVDDGTHVRDEHCEGQPKPKKITYACATHCTLQ